jgi:nucleoside-diphosphate-sugar epimerase
MAKLLCFGFGYCAEHFVAAFGGRFERIAGTMRGTERAAILNAYDGEWQQALVFDGTQSTAKLEEIIADASHVLISIPPAETGDRVLAAAAANLGAAKSLQSIVYLSTIGVYGDHDCGWVDEATPPKPESARSRARLAAEQAWQDFGARSEVRVAILRLAGIYGPGQNALVQLQSGKARRIVKPGQIFNHVHVADIAQAIDAAFTLSAAGIFNVADDAPSAPGDPVVFAAQLLGCDPPPEIKFADAAQSMSPMALSFWQECRRVKNDKLKGELGVSLLYPTYREGLRALFDAEKQNARPAQSH